MHSLADLVILKMATELAQKEENTLKNVTPFRIEDYCFPKQVTFIRDKSRFKTAVCSRRAGKTISCAADLVDTALTYDEIDCIYITKTRGVSKRIVWKELLKINKKFNLGAKDNTTELTLTFPNGSTIYLTGAKDASEIEKFRGMAIKRAYIDECQSFPTYLKDLIDEIIVPTLIDYQGSLCLIGTPSPTCAGLFYEASSSGLDEDGFGYSHHHWTFKDNPFLLEKAKKHNPDIKTADDILEFELKRRKTTINDPSIGREWLGLWLKDLSLAIYKFDNQLNVYDVLPFVQWRYVAGYDLGFDDSDAGVMWAYNKHLPYVYIVDEFKVAKQDISDLAKRIAAWNEKYNPVKSVIDTGGLGKKITEELKNRYSFHLEPAEKIRKKEFIEIMNSDMKLGRIKVPKKAMVQSEWELLIWDVEELAKNKWVEDAAFENHLCDAALYSWRECYHFLYEEKPIEPEFGTPEYFKHQENLIEKQIEEEFKRNQRNDFDNY